MVEFCDAWNITSTFLGYEADIELGEHFLSLLSKANFLIEDKSALLVLLDLSGQRFAGLFDSHFTRKFDFHFDGDDGKNKG